MPIIIPSGLPSAIHLNKDNLTTRHGETNSYGSFQGHNQSLKHPSTKYYHLMHQCTLHFQHIKVLKYLWLNFVQSAAVVVISVTLPKGTWNPVGKGWFIFNFPSNCKLCNLNWKVFLQNLQWNLIFRTTIIVHK